MPRVKRPISDWCHVLCTQIQESFKDARAENQMVFNEILTRMNTEVVQICRCRSLMYLMYWIRDQWQIIISKKQIVIQFNSMFSY
jgi:hypothetical protein